MTTRIIESVRVAAPPEARLHRGTAGEEPAHDHGDFETFFASRVRAAEAYTNGEYALLAPLVAEQGGASFHSPRGDTVSGVEAVAEGQ